MDVNKLIDLELAEREEAKKEIMKLVYTGFDCGVGKLPRGVVQRYVYEALGLHGRPGNHFARFMNKTLQENGFRVGFHGGRPVVFGLVVKATNVSLENETSDMLVNK